MTRANQTIEEAAYIYSHGKRALGFVLEAIHTYTDRHGNVLHYHLRCKHPATGEKWMPFMMPSGSAIIPRKPVYPNGAPIYNLYKLASRPDETVYVVEGEACADALDKLGALATTSGSSGSAEAADWQPLAGRAVKIWPDNDRAGQGYAVAVAAILLGLGCKVQTIDVAALGLADKDDAVDWMHSNPEATLTGVDALPVLMTRTPSDGEPAKDDGRTPANVDTGKPRINCPPRRNVVLQRASDIPVRAIEWLWTGMLARGKLVILAGASATGKTTVALDIGATVTIGGVFPDGTRCTSPGNILIWSGEDSPSDTLIPRLSAAGADLERCHFITCVAEDGRSDAFDFAEDIHDLERAVEKIGGIALLIVDPIVNVVSGDMNQANAVRRSLQPLVDFAERHNCAVLGITHFSKGSTGRHALDRVIGSQAFSAVARTVLVTAKEEGGDRRVLACAKSNIAPDDGGFAYRLEQVTLLEGLTTNRVVWDGTLEGTAREILGEVEYDEKDMGERAEAEDFLRQVLLGGPVPTNDVAAQAKEAGISVGTLRRAKRSLGVKSVRKGEMGKQGGGIWLCSLPQEVKVINNGLGAQPESLNALTGDEHLNHEIGDDEPLSDMTV